MSLQRGDLWNWAGDMKKSFFVEESPTGPHVLVLLPPRFICNFGDVRHGLPLNPDTYCRIPNPIWQSRLRNESSAYVQNIPRKNENVTRIADSDCHSCNTFGPRASICKLLRAAHPFFWAQPCIPRFRFAYRGAFRQMRLLSLVEVQSHHRS